MNFQQLRIIRETVRCNFNLTEVANALFTSQSGVSKHIKDLEDELGVELFIRKGKRLLGLTDPGQELLGIVERMLLDAKNIKNLADQYTRRDEGQLTVATTHTQSRYALPHVVTQFKQIFPDVSSENVVICVSGIGARSGFSAFMSAALPCLDIVEKSQCFPLYLYDDPNETKAPSQSQGSLFDTPAPEPKQRTRRDAITDEGLQHFQSAYPSENISKEDLFYYIYGLLHSEQYREWYADNLAKELPRIPRVKLAADFWAFSKAGRELATLHIGYERVEPYPATVSIAGGKTLDDCQPQDFRVEKMRYGKNGKEKDLTTLHYNSKITVTGIPPEAYEYVVNGKPALDWVVERQCVKTDKDSGIVNDANDWAIETMHNPRYPLELFLRVITVSLETLKIVNALPKLEKEELS